MPSVLTGDPALARSLNEFDGVVDAGERARLLDRFLTTPSGRERPGRVWKIDLEAIAPAADSIGPNAVTVTIQGAHERAIACDLRTAFARHGDLVARAFGATPARDGKFGALATAFAGDGAFVYVPAGIAADDHPVVVTYDVAAGASAFPATIVLVERGSRACVVERLTGGRDAFVCGLVEVVTGEGASVEFATMQTLDPTARVLQTRYARPDRDDSIVFASAELGGTLAVSDIGVVLEQPGCDAEIAAVFFPSGTQHVDVVSIVDHRAGDTTSSTLVKSAATGSGQARYLGRIAIARHAQGTDASLRDDALILSKRAHIDSVPALEIAANEVKAYHGATVGAIDDEQIFYMESRGIARDDAERMIALGFFEPALEHFPASLREELRALLAAKLA